MNVRNYIRRCEQSVKSPPFLLPCSVAYLYVSQQTPPSWGSALFAKCELQYSLQQLLQREKAGLPPRHRTGGLGLEMQPSIFEVHLLVSSFA
jgi:hypothetical protein